MGTVLSTPATGVIITGGGSGIGRATAHALAEVGRPVAIWDLNREAAVDAAEEVAKTWSVTTIGLGLDVCDTPRFGEAIASSRDTLGSIGGFVHGAGIPGVSPVDTLDEAVWNRTLSIHLTAAALLIRDLTPDLVANPGSAIVLVASIEAIHGHEAIPAYCAAKSGMLGLVRSTTALLAPRGVRRERGVSRVRRHADAGAHVVGSRDPGGLHQPHPDEAARRARRHRQGDPLPALRRGVVRVGARAGRRRRRHQDHDVIERDPARAPPT